MHELFEHTADLGLRATAPTLPALFAEMGKCLLAAMIEDPAGVRPLHETTIVFDGSNAEYLLFDWLNRLLRLADDGKELHCEFEIVVGPEGLSAIAFGEPFDPERHTLAREVKAITYHELKVVEHDGGWLAEAIVDI